MYKIESIAQIVNGTFLQKGDNAVIEHLLYDSRTVSFPAASLFFALHTQRQDGHYFIADAYRKGVRCFVVDREIVLDELPGATVLRVANTLQALQQLAMHHRKQFSIPVIGITGSNGKTVVKEWLYQLLQMDYKIARSPKSYNSQIGVPLSVWQLQPEHTLALFEAGISHKGEMQTLAAIIQPTIGVLTNIGEAHSENFDSLEQKAIEKVQLFQTAEVVVYPEDDSVASLVLHQGERSDLLPYKHFSWGNSPYAQLHVDAVSIQDGRALVAAVYNKQSFQIIVPFIDDASVQNALTCSSVLLQLGYSVDVINERLQGLHAVDMRLQLKHGLNNSVIINDSYSADLTSLHIALHFMSQQNVEQKRTVILSDFVESGLVETRLYEIIAAALVQHRVSRVIAIGEKISRYIVAYLPDSIQLQCFLSTEEFLAQIKISTFQQEVILVKGARRFLFERVVQLLEVKVHQTRLEINLNAISHNLKQYQALLKPSTKVMVMVKAFAYGSGSSEIASVLQFNKVDYLGVAYADEGVALRKGGISLPIMVMNADEASFYSITEYNLQPVLYSFEILERFEQHVQNTGLQNYPVHLEVETGMNRLGFAVSDIEAVGKHLRDQSLLAVESLFSHLAASEDPAQDAYTQQQAGLYQQAAAALEKYITYPFLKHISNSAAIVRHPQLQWDMVRLGIGVYGVEIATEKLDLQPVATLRTTIAQLKHLIPGESVSYNRRGVVTAPSLIATVRIGYADGYSRRLGYGTGKMWVNGQLVPVIGTVCMDMTMINVTHLPHVKVGDEVVVFGNELPIEQLAGWAGTIPYEIMTGISQRVKRVYFQE
ncbi:bifunctional UDP-N-acetylmuramoyl-tripeptide:D-alanyl-D-alanine ligase/alanine racemase [Flavisolibacter tropicus]|uniref:Alanine racemase n=1 Tax=Flavisolibacter tropicus TaxID=1492898 RepID=A0A172TVE9_9BACT|nr:bifunctional UDP-N-acetylmuramoyl-tripeptide:D-alanyl-D-alanine ligase/alanine racemase [Flavisolibacter tropicus]ANE51101.1 alanine racemase [Flavisolibacter tropicus]